MLPAMLDSVAGVCDEIVAVDTGSVDGTARILADAGARVHSVPWHDDFAEARNASLDLATGEWILVMDADERLQPESVNALEATIGAPDVGAATVVMRNATSGGMVREARLLRLFRRHPGVRFRHRIHEDVGESVAAALLSMGLRMAHPPVLIDHLGYARSVAAERGKRDRDWRVLSLLLDEAPDDLYAHFKRLEQARFWGDLERWRAAASEATAALLRATPEALRSLHVADELVSLIATTPGATLLADPLTFLKRTLAHLPESAVGQYWVGFLCESAHRADEAAAAYRKAIAIGGARDPQFSRVRPLLGLVRVDLARGHLSGTMERAMEALREAPLDVEALALVLLCATMQRGPQGARAMVAPLAVEYGHLPGWHGILDKAARSLRMPELSTMVDEH